MDYASHTRCIHVLVHEVYWPKHGLLQGWSFVIMFEFTHICLDLTLQLTGDKFPPSNTAHNLYVEKPDVL